LKCVLNVECGIMQPSILLLSYMIEMLKIRITWRAIKFPLHWVRLTQDY
jgi:hypothetical protein